MCTAGDYPTSGIAHSHDEAKSFQKPALLDMVAKIAQLRRTGPLALGCTSLTSLMLIRCQFVGIQWGELPGKAR
jgi:hypothetical protein